MLTLRFNFTKFFKRLSIAIIFTILFLNLQLPSFAASGINRFVNFQGKLVNNPSGTNVSNTTYTVVFTIYDKSSGGTALWTETQTVTTADGIFRVALGSVTPIPSNFNFNWSDLFLGMKVNSDSEMTPRVQLAAVPYAFNAEKVSGLTVQDNSGNASTSGTLQVANAKTITFNDAFSTSNAMSFGSGTTGTITLGTGTNTLSLATTGNTSVTLPTSGTLCTTISCLASDPFWNQSLGSLFPNNSTADLIIGSQASVSARFRVIANNLGAGTLGVASISGKTSFATLVTNNDGVGDLFTASSSSQSRFTIKGNGSITANAYQTCTLKTDSTGLFTCGVDNVGAGASPFTENTILGTIFENNNTEDFLLGGTASTTAKFAVLGIAGARGTQIASLSGSLTLDASGVIQTTSDQTLTLGGNTTGQLVLSGFNGAVNGITFSGYNTCTLKTTVSGVVTCGTDLTGAGSSSPFQELAGAIVPNNSTEDLLIGGQSTASALFSYTGLSTGQTIASISGQFILMPNNGYGGNASLSGQLILGAISNPKIQTTKNQNLIIGGDTTGSIILKSKNTTVFNVAGDNLHNTFVGDSAGFNTTGSDFTFLGYQAGFNNTSGSGDSFLGSQAGFSNTSGYYNTFLGQLAGFNNTSGFYNTFLGHQAGYGNTSGFYNTFLGSQAGYGNTTGGNNTFLGIQAGYGNTTGGNNTSLGYLAGYGNTTGGNNTFLGYQAGYWNKSGGSNVFFGYNANPGSGNLVNAGAIGTNAFVNQSDSLILGSINGVNSATGSARIGIGTIAPAATLDVLGVSGTIPTASISGRTSFAGLLVDQSGLGDIFTASSSGATRFTIGRGGFVRIGTSTDGLTFDPQSGPNYYGNARPVRKIDLSPEYAGAVLTASGSATTNGSMTSDASPSANFRTYYEWSSTQPSLQDYTVAVRVTLPNDFSAWTTSNALTIEFNTATTTNTNNKLDVIIINPNDANPTTPVVMRTANVSSVAKTWQTITIPASEFINNTAKWQTAGQTAVIYLKMYAGQPTYTQVGDIVLNYLSIF